MFNKEITRVRRAIEELTKRQKAWCESKEALKTSDKDLYLTLLPVSSKQTQLYMASIEAYKVALELLEKFEDCVESKRVYTKAHNEIIELVSEYFDNYMKHDTITYKNELDINLRVLRSVFVDDGEIISKKEFNEITKCKF